MAERPPTNKLHEDRAVWNGGSVLPDHGLDIRSETYISRSTIVGLLHLLCHVIFPGDVPMSRVKMNAKHEYEFIANFKVLQNVFRAKKIDKARAHRLNETLEVIDLPCSQPIPVDRLVKCKMQYV